MLQKYLQAECLTAAGIQPQRKNESVYSMEEVWRQSKIFYVYSMGYSVLNQAYSEVIQVLP